MIAGASVLAGAVWMAGPAALRGWFVCPIRQYLGLLCPGCGGTRAVMALLHGRFAEAWHSNALLVLLLPLAGLYAGAVVEGVMRRRADPFPAVPLPAVSLLLAAVMGFAVARNLAQ